MQALELAFMASSKRVTELFTRYTVDHSRNVRISFSGGAVRKASTDRLFEGGLGLDGSTLSQEGFFRFLRQEQGMQEAPDSELQSIWNAARRSEPKEMRLCEFQWWLLSDANDVVDPVEHRVSQDMSQPLAAYYINSSHNSYLDGHQWTSTASSDMYRRHLLMGCRCVEIDCWDGKDHEPQVTHGNTLVNRVPFKEVAQAIAETAFVNSPYPIILSLEMHCCPEQQTAIVHYMEAAFGDHLLRPTEWSTATLAQLPSPEELKFKILVKAKKVLPILAPVCYLPSTKFNELRSRAERAAPCEMASLSEAKIGEISRTSREAMIVHNDMFLSRTYPDGSRVGSSNFDPTAMWGCGCQMVCLNYQTWDLGMRLNLGKFAHLNGNCGYILKPKTMRQLSTSPLRGVHAPPLKFPSTASVALEGKDSDSDDDEGMMTPRGDAATRDDVAQGGGGEGDQTPDEAACGGEERSPQLEEDVEGAQESSDREEPIQVDDADAEGSDEETQDGEFVSAREFELADDAGGVACSGEEGHEEEAPPEDSAGVECSGEEGMTTPEDTGTERSDEDAAASKPAAESPPSGSRLTRANAFSPRRRSSQRNSAALPSSSSAHVMWTALPPEVAERRRGTMPRSATASASLPGRRLLGRRRTVPVSRSADALAARRAEMAAEAEAGSVWRSVVKIELISGHALPKVGEQRCQPELYDQYCPPPSFKIGNVPTTAKDATVCSPYVEIDVHSGDGLGCIYSRDAAEKARGSREKGVKRTCKFTSAAATEGLHAKWAQSVECVVVSPEDAMVTFHVHDKAHNELLAFEALPLQALRVGYRVVHLRAPTGNRLRHGSLLVHVSKDFLRSNGGRWGVAFQRLNNIVRPKYTRSSKAA